MKATIHCKPAIEWQKRRAQFFAEGLKKLGIEYEITADCFRHDGLPILLGTTFWRDIESTGNYLLVDRCSFGDTDIFTSLVWNGHGRRGNHKVPADYDASRWNKYGIELQPWKSGNKRVACGQIESYCNQSLFDWYRSTHATHFRTHPAGGNPTGLPAWQTFDDCELVTLNSSVAIQGFINGIKTEVHDDGGMAYGAECTDEGRIELMHWLAWTQWTDDEVRCGIKHLFEEL